MPSTMAAVAPPVVPPLPSDRPFEGELGGVGGILGAPEDKPGETVDRPACSSQAADQLISWSITVITNH